MTGSRIGNLLILAASFGWAAPSSKELLDALWTGDTTAIKRLVAAGAPLDAVDESGSSALMYAALYTDAATMRLLLDKGANPNHTDRAGATAVTWSASDAAKVRLLVERGANVNASPLTGRTPLLIAAAWPGNAGIVRLLLDRGADPNVTDKTNSLDHWAKTPILAAAGSGDTETLKLLLAKGVDPNLRTGFFTPFFAAALTGSRRNVELLLERGANISGSPALFGAVGDAALFRRLLKKGADPRARGVAGMDVMMWLAANEDSDPDVARELLALGFDPAAGLKNLHTEHGYGAGVETPLDWARRHGDTPVASVLTGAKKPVQRQAAVPAEEPSRLNAGSPRAAIEKALPLLFEGSREFFKRSGCVSCHHNALPAVAFSMARARHIKLDEEKARRNSEQSVAHLKGNQEGLFQGVSLNGSDSTLAYLLWGLSADGYRRDRATDAAAYYLAEVQRLEGWWRVIPGRPPMESIVAATAIAIRALQAYPLPGHGPEFETRIRKAAQWLANYSPRTGEERAMRVLGLAWAGGQQQILNTAAKQLLATQRADGGWAQLDTLASDAYATGQALYALHKAGHAPEQAIKRAVKFLLETQLADGSWHVRSRSYPVQANYFDTGFPHGRDQWISAAGTSWAVIGLSLAARP